MYALPLRFQRKQTYFNPAYTSAEKYPRQFIMEQKCEKQNAEISMAHQNTFETKKIKRM